jgi:hypothetical protein
MKMSEFKTLIREEIKRVLNEGTVKSFLNESSITYTIKEIDKDEFAVYAKMSSKIVGELRLIKSKFKLRFLVFPEIFSKNR